MSLDAALDEFPKQTVLRDGLSCAMRPLIKTDSPAFHQFFCAMPALELMFIKHRVVDPEVITGWCDGIDLGRNFPLLAVAGDKVIGVCTLHQQLGGWKRHIGRVSVQVHPEFRQRGLAKVLVHEIVDIARQCGLEKLEAEFIEKQEGAMQMFALMGFATLVRLTDYVKDMQAVTHDYILMGMDLITDEEYAGVGG
jgi:GNAT superfamily N-acetyltransferase